MARKGEIKQLETVLRDYAMSFPGATEDFPWGERVIKVNKKVFVFMGKDQAEDFSMSVKLPTSLEVAMDVSEKLLKGWIGESYRAVAPARLVSQLDGKPPSSKKTKQKR